MKPQRFTKAEAESLQGKRIRARAFIDVPQGAFGQINGWQEAEAVGTYNVIARFEPVLTAKPVLKWLSKSDYLQLVEEMTGRLAERPQPCVSTHKAKE